MLVAAFQEVDHRADIATLGRGGSDTTAVALAAVLGADACAIPYILELAREAGHWPRGGRPPRRGRCGEVSIADAADSNSESDFR
jgi:hypothetical protein